MTAPSFAFIDTFTRCNFSDLFYFLTVVSDPPYHLLPGKLTCSRDLSSASDPNILIKTSFSLCGVTSFMKLTALHTTITCKLYCGAKC
jgi:hypothetical protein